MAEITDKLSENCKHKEAIRKVTDQLEWMLDSGWEFLDLAEQFRLLDKEERGRNLAKKIFDTWFRALAQYIAKNQVTEIEIEKAINKLSDIKLGGCVGILSSGGVAREFLQDKQRSKRVKKVFCELKDRGLLNAVS